MKILSGFIAATAMTFGAAHAGIISSNFDTDAEGFTVQAGGSLSYEAVGGNPGGFLRIADSTRGVMQIVLPSQFLVPIAVGDVLTFDANELVNPGGNFEGFGTVSLSGLAGTASGDFFVGDLPLNQWTSVQVVFEESNFSSVNGNFADIISDLSSIVITVESGNTIIEVVGIDNVVLRTTDAAIPVPAAALIFPLGAAMMAGLRRRLK